MSRRVLVSGGGGFAGGHLLAELRAAGEEPIAPSSSEVDLLDARAVRDLVARMRPEAVFHLAALASVGRSWGDPRAALIDNQAMTLNLLDAVREQAPGARVLLASSGEVYGRPERLPLTEDAPLRPQNPYAVAKAACDLLGGLYADAHDLHVVRTRAFNHAGPGQTDDYVIGTLTRQVAEAEAAGAREVVLRTGNPDAARDFTDVRDVVRAYRLAVDLPAGVYNVASGRAVAVRELVELLRAATPLTLRHEVDAARVREHEVAEVRGSAERLSCSIGWSPAIPLEQTVRDALDDWRARLAQSGS